MRLPGRIVGERGFGPVFREPSNEQSKKIHFLNTSSMCKGVHRILSLVKVSLKFSLCAQDPDENIGRAAKSARGALGYSRKHEPLVYVRSCYGKILDLIWAHSETLEIAFVVVLGTPGISKSSFVFVVLWELLQKHCWNLILLKFKESNRYYAFDKDSKVSSTVSSAVTVNWVEAEEEGKVWYLADWKIGKYYWSLPCKVVIATSLGWLNHHHFFKGDDVIRLFIPMWSHEEIHMLNDQVFKHPKAKVDKRIMGDFVWPTLLVLGDDTYTIATKKLVTPYITDKLATRLNMDVLDRVLNYDLATADSENGVYTEFFDRPFFESVIVKS
ncbi:hypothetical protein SELMODRAFT_407947 [Selaginella moellendorffii]|uniref:Uncharacterized protein n=1 Tax=Selaginella moellendorffii TaxID=88036 RepID=D8R5A6_SELML|nr:hypothetical protein SELMODRAFT_407947 [Selaginella moellendorffii]